jgi:NADH dehydrogenase [ubiquinone] 1 alpha subcomplex assembly factor 7
MTSVEHAIRELIAADGPMPIDTYMAACLGHYYSTRDPLGAAGDFTTAPEISQVFGELVGVWIAQAWQQIGAPAEFSLVELGPGRGTLMKDVLRATRKVPGFHAAARVHLAETSPALRAVQKGTLGEVSWHDTIATLPSQPSLIIANEFFDAIPIQQFEQVNDAVFERRVAVEEDKLRLVLTDTPQRNPFDRDGVFELSPARTSIAMALGALITAHGGAGLIIDYGHRKSAMGDTLQAMRSHQFCSIFDTPGEADITSHVDFENLGGGFVAGGAASQLMTQGDFLRAMGLEMRASVLERGLSDAELVSFRAGIKRIADDDQMGQLFKVMAVTRAGQSHPYPFGET